MVIQDLRSPLRLGLLLGAGLLLAVAAVLVVRGLAGGDQGVVFGDGHDEQEAYEVGQDVTVRGEVVENTIDPCLFPMATPCLEDAGFALRLDAEGRRISVWYSLGMGEACPNQQAADQGTAARVGTTVEAHGEVESAGDRVSLTTCTSPDHYIRAIE